MGKVQETTLEHPGHGVGKEEAARDIVHQARSVLHLMAIAERAKPRLPHVSDQE